MPLTREQFLKQSDVALTLREENIEGFGKIYLRGMDGFARDQFDNAVLESGDDKVVEKMRALLVSLCVCDEKGVLLFTPEDVDLLNGRSGDVLGKIADIVIEVNGLNKKEVNQGNS
jgi:hypothetical protein